ncbi:MAG: hypothetical protein OCD01_15945 [Fibrobacterales bacterium]
MSQNVTKSDYVKKWHKTILLSERIDQKSSEIASVFENDIFKRLERHLLQSRERLLAITEKDLLENNVDAFTKELDQIFERFTRFERMLELNSIYPNDGSNRTTI